ncbi:hypothetical protein [Methanocaldococcus fervens]|uniref:Uncharacterized protein n=1 Tax=Methanocaldococcus fervens (strain DSM 4213 / JCM 15782 / AG86) TaxID=573064 RepID=C7P9P0_METFA|nr:hypothetical protein [Methanocaldococcus fervens]ACV25397.1 hypothetical protein Mefer_1594 [Methanocaldococcus fervens AG86]
MANGANEKTDFKLKLLKAVAFSIGMGAVFYYGAQQSVTFNEVVSAFASVPLLVIIVVELLDKAVDSMEVFNQLYSTYGGKSEYGKYAMTFIGMLIAFFGMLWLVSGTITLNVGSMSPANLVVAALLSLYILAPETGDDELILFAWLGATIATFGKYLTLIPHIPGLTT